MKRKSCPTEPSVLRAQKLQGQENTAFGASGAVGSRPGGTLGRQAPDETAAKRGPRARAIRLWISAVDFMLFSPDESSIALASVFFLRQTKKGRSELDRKSLGQRTAANTGKNAELLYSKPTTRYRHKGNESARCCVFLLTENSCPLILRFQIRGIVEAPDGPDRRRSGSFEGHEANPGFRKTFQREVTLRAL
jgi:hypothetical protein